MTHAVYSVICKKTWVQNLNNLADNYIFSIRYLMVTKYKII